jgi:hypothetical protein
MVQEKYKAHHVGCCNSDSVGIEHGGYAHKNTWTQSQLSSSFALICDIAKRNNIPVSRNTIQAHADLDPSRRTDPGPYYPWDKMLSEVQACVSGKPTAKPDLSIQQLTWTPASPKVGDDVTFHATVKNANVSSGANVGIAFFINNQQVGFDATTEMNANATITFNMRDPWTPDQNGQFTIKALVDDLNIVDESNENNNIYSSTITISGGETTQKPDLVVNSLTFSTPSINNFVTLYAKVTNGGEAINQHFNLAFYINQSIVGTDSISSLEKGESHTFQLQNQWSPKTEGQYNYSVMVDQLKQIDESNEANNTTAKTITVTNPGGGDGDSGGSDCASESLTNNLRNGQQLQQSLRSLRDEELQQSIMGQRIVNLYYKHTDEVKAMIKKDWILRVLGLRLILRSTYAFQPRQIANNIVPLNKGYTKMTIGFIERAQSMGSDELKKDFDEIKELVNSLQGLTANELLDELRNY